MVIVHTLGQALIEAGTVRVTPTSVRKFALLLYLSADAGRHASRSVLRELIFPEQTEKNARHSLRELAYQLRLAGVAFSSDSDGLAILHDAVTTDHVQLLARSRLDVHDLRAAEGGFLPGYAPTHSEAFCEWFEGHRARTTFDICKALLREVKRTRTVGDWGGTELAARACLALDPMNEEGTLALAEALAIGGSKTQAIKLLDRYAEELGSCSRELKLPTQLAKRRISDQLAQVGRYPQSSTFVGRSSEMLHLQARFDVVKQEQAQCVVIYGEPGIGKSRLLTEFRTVALLDGAVSATAVMQPNDAYRPFGAFSDLLPTLLAMPGALGCAPESLRSLDRLAKIPRMGLVEPETSAASDALCDSVTHAIIDLVDAIAGEQAIVLAIEDANWLDEMSARVLSSLVSGPPRKLLTVLTTRRLKRVPILPRDGAAITTIHVPRLGSDAVTAMTGALADSGRISIDAPMRQWLETTSEGNPLFLESLVAHYTATHERFVISPTLTALLDRRIEMLSRDGATVLRVCALLGKHSSLETISKAIDLPRFALLQSLAELEESVLIKADGSCVRPSHALIADVAQRKAGVVELQFAHRCVATALETLLATEHATAVLWDCADHWIQAQNSAGALRAIWSCSRYAVDIGRPREAAVILSRALTLDLRRDDRAAIARQLVLAADSAGESELVFKGLRELHGLGVAEEHDNIEFAEFRARIRTFQDAPSPQQRLLRCARDTNATAHHRIAAATLILKFADTHGKLGLVPEAIAAGTAVLSAASEKERVEFSLLRDCVLGEWDAARKAATDLLALAPNEPLIPRCQSRMNASAGLWRSGFPSMAIDALGLAYLDAHATGSLRQALTAAAIAADFSFDIEDDHAGQVWVDKALASVLAVPDLANHYLLALVRVISSIIRGQFADARSVFDDACSRGIFDGSRLQERWKRVFEFRLRLSLNDELVPSEEIRRIGREIDEPRPMSGIVDFEVATACASLMRADQWADARRLRDRFLASNRRTTADQSRAFRNVSRAIDESIVRRSPALHAEANGFDNNSLGEIARPAESH